MDIVRWNISVYGSVQGVGFRPFVYHLARGVQLSGWVRNSENGVAVEVEGLTTNLEKFVELLNKKKPPNARIEEITIKKTEPRNDKIFKIISSSISGNMATSIPSDIAMCSNCLEELFDPENHRYYYPFITCADCGPRYSIANSLPFDRAHTAMSIFDMCDSCKEEYNNPEDRRFHAQTIACSDCGPHLELWDKKGNVIEEREKALESTADAIKDGKIVALKGLGGFHLITDARNDNSVKALRKRKHRGNKPFALMYPSLETIERDCEVSTCEKEILTSVSSPIVLVERKNKDGISPAIAPNNPYLGVMLPYTPLHHLIMHRLGFPIVATSGNRLDEPLCTDENEAINELAGIADLFLVHNRPISNPVDDSVVRVINKREMVIRRARGYAPLPITLPEPLPATLATGGYLKNTVALSVESKLYLSPHIGNLNNKKSYDLHRKNIDTLYSFNNAKPEMVVGDMHPDYPNKSQIQFQHHYCHILSCMLDNQFDGDCLGVSWDGAGYGDDGTIWGGEFLQINKTSYRRLAHFLPFPLPGGEKAIKDPKRSALGLLHILKKDVNLPIDKDTLILLKTMLNKKINCPLTSSVGRLFDAVSALTGLCYDNTFEGEASMALEFAANNIKTDRLYDYKISGSIIDWRPIVSEILTDLNTNKPVSEISAAFHHTLAKIIVDTAQKTGQQHVALSGGCFQNKFLTEITIDKLEKAGLKPLWHRNIPPNDGGLSAGQVLAAARSRIATQEQQQCA